MVGYETVMVPVADVPAPQHRVHGSFYRAQLARFVLSDDERVLVVVPGRKAGAVYKGLSRARDDMAEGDRVAVWMRQGSVFLERRDEGGVR